MKRKIAQFKRTTSQLLFSAGVLVVALSFLPYGFADQGPTKSPSPTAAQQQPTVVVQPGSAAPVKQASQAQTSSGPDSKWYSSFSKLFSELSAEDVGAKPRIRPHFAFNQGFVSNANLGQSQADAAWGARIAPGISISLPFDRLYGMVDYTYAFSTFQGRETSANLNTHNLDMLLRYDLTDSTTIGVSNNIQWSDIPLMPNDTFMLESLVTELNHRFTNKFSSNTKYTFQYFNDRSTSDFTSRENDFSDNGITEALSYDVTRAINVTPSFAWHTRDFKRVRQKDYWQVSPYFDTTYKLGSKTTLGGRFGWAFRQFREGDDHESELIYGASLSHLMGRKFVWNVNYDKRLTDTYDTDFIYREDAETETLDNYDRNFRVIKTHRISTTADYYFTEKISGGVFGNFQFASGEKEDNVVTRKKNHEKEMEVGVRAGYRINRFLSLNMLYSFGRRFSSNDEETLSRRTYTFHKVTGGLNIQL